MDAITDLLVNYGYWGMLLSAFLAGSFLPFSSEAVMVALLAAKLDSWQLIIYATIGNVLGGMFVPIVGSAITIVLGLTRANIPISVTSITVGKFLRYVLLVYGASLFF
mgnify:CR=1 FL=1